MSMQTASQFHTLAATAEDRRAAGQRPTGTATEKWLT